MSFLERLELGRVRLLAWFPVCQAYLKLEQEGLKQGSHKQMTYICSIKNAEIEILNIRKTKL